MRLNGKKKRGTDYSECKGKCSLYTRKGGTNFSDVTDTAQTKRENKVNSLSKQGWKVSIGASKAIYSRLC